MAECGHFSAVSKHYAGVANCYDELYAFTYDYIAEFATEHLQLKPDDLLVDIGAGTGAISSLISRKAGLTNPVLCAEPSKEMLGIVATRDGVKPYLATADAFFSQCNTTPKYNKILINESAHLFLNPQETFCKAFEYLQEDGLLVLIQRSTQCTFPMWKALEEAFAPISVEQLMEYLEKVGFKVTMSVKVGTTKMTKQEWYDKLRRRMFTTLGEFTDEDIEKGIRELNQSWFPDKGENDVIEIRDSLVIFTAIKQ